MTTTLRVFMLLCAGLMLAGPARGQTLPDPTRPANYSVRLAASEELPQQFINWDVRAIRTAESGRNAVVNGRLVKIGDEIDTARIVDITPDSVVLDYDRRQLVLRLLPEDIKKKRTESSNQERE
jgi:hypothetical protein